MRFDASDIDSDFRHRLREWISDNLVPDWRTRFSDEIENVEFQRSWDVALFKGGWAGMWWPEEFGGVRATAAQRAVYEEEMATAGAPPGLARAGRRLLGPAIMRYGTSEQKGTLLPPILSGETIWCQGFSEPEAGSDLANLSTHAVVDGDGYLVSGQKTWTSLAHYSDMCFALVRTEPGSVGRNGISMLLIDLSSPGVEVRPILQITGRTDFCEVFFTDVRVPPDAIVGAPGAGWEVAKYLLSHERGAAMIFSHLVRMRGHLDQYLEVALADPEEAPEAAELSVKVFCAALLANKILSSQMNGGEPGTTGSIAKLYWSETWRELGTKAFVASGEQLLVHSRADGTGDDLANLFLESRKNTISAGASEVQRDIVARRVLGLPFQKKG